MNEEQLTFFRSVFDKGIVPNLTELVRLIREQNTKKPTIDDFERELYSHETIRLFDRSFKASFFEIDFEKTPELKEMCERVDPNECLRILVRTMIRWGIDLDPVLLSVFFNMIYIIDYETNYGISRNYENIIEKYKYMAIYDAAYRVSLTGERIGTAFGVRRHNRTIDRNGVRSAPTNK